NAVAPVVAPMLGGAILAIPSAYWETIFYALALIGVLIVAIVAAELKETLPPENRIPSSVGSSVKTMCSLLQDGSFVGFALVVGFVHVGSCAYISGTPSVYQQT